MTSQDFCYWLQGYFELGAKGVGPDLMLSLQQVKCIQDHLALVFAHEIDPSYGDEKHQKILNNIHNNDGYTSEKLIRC